MAYDMYCKLFASLYQGTLRGASHEILVFTNLLAHAGRTGVVDKHFRAIAEETGLTMDEVKAAILTLESPDPESRSPDEAGARIVREDEHRVWGWRIVNYGKYRAIRSEEDRAEQNRLAQERWRNKNKPPSAEDKQDKPMQKERDKQKEKQQDSDAKGSRPTSSDSEWIASLKTDPTYEGIDVQREYGKMCNWCSTNSKTPTRRRFTNWLNRAEKPIQGVDGTLFQKPRAMSFDERKRKIGKLRNDRNELFKMKQDDHREFTGDETEEYRKLTQELKALEAE